MKLFLDDKREINPVDPSTPRAPNYVDSTWTHVRNADQAIALLRTGQVIEASLDHDLGHCEACTECKGYADRSCSCRCHLTGYFVVCWMETEDVWPPNGTRVHSANPGGALKMRLAIDRHYERLSEESRALLDRGIAEVKAGQVVAVPMSYFDEALAGATEALGVIGTGKLRDGPLVSEGPRSYVAESSAVRVDLPRPAVTVTPGFSAFMRGDLFDESPTHKGLQAAMEKSIRERMDFIAQHTERLIEAFLAETGCMPSEAEIVQNHRPDGSMTIHVQKRKT